MPKNTITTTTTTKRKYTKRSPKWRKKGRSTLAIPRQMRVRTYAFSRSVENLLAMEAPTDGWITAGNPLTTGACLVKTFTFDLAELPNHLEFKNLYRQYKLNYAVVKMFPSYSSIVSTTGPIVTNNCIITIWPNTDGKALDATFLNENLLEKQAKKQFLMPQNKPLKLGMPLHQLRNTYGGSTLGVPLVDYAVKKPSYIGTDELTTPHYGFNVHIRKVDGSSFASNSPRFLVKEKIYFTCRQVQ